MNYHYDKGIHAKSLSSSEINTARFFGLLIMIYSVVAILIWSADVPPRRLWLDIIVFISGLFMVLFPKYSYIRPWNIKGRFYVKSDNEQLDWKFGRDNGSVRYSDVESFTQNTGEYHFQLKNGESEIFKIYNVENQEKYLELKTLLRNVLPS